MDRIRIAIRLMATAFFLEHPVRSMANAMMFSNTAMIVDAAAKNIQRKKSEEKEMDEKKIKRINELYHKSKAEGLTDAEKKEQQLLRQEYIASVRENLRGQLNNISIQEKDGSITDLGKKYGRKKGN